MDKNIYDEMLLTLHHAHPFLSTNTVPLSIGCGQTLRDTLSQSFKPTDVNDFINEYFSRPAYLICLMNSIDLEKPIRFDLDGRSSGNLVITRDLLPLAFNPLVYLSDNLSSKAKAFCLNQKKIKDKSNRRLKGMTQQLEVLGFTPSVIKSKLGIKAERYLTGLDPLAPYPKDMIHNANQMCKKSKSLGKRKLKVFQSNLLDNNIPVPIIIKASNNYQDYLYYRLFEALDNKSLRSKFK